MSFADRRNFRPQSATLLARRVWRLVIALAAVVIAALIPYSVAAPFGFAESFVLFTPIILLVGMFDGFWLGIFFTFISTFIARYLFLEPRHAIAIADIQSVTGVLPFVVLGIGVSFVGDLLRRRTQRLKEFEKAVQGLQEMIVVIDRDYRYLIANDAFLQYRGIKREEVVGHHVRQVLTGGVFERSVKEKLDECFAGKIVQYEMRYEYPVRGERDLLISYFPIEGKHGIDRVACVLQDMTDLRQSEHSLRLFRRLIDASNDSVLVVDPGTYRVLDVNERACRDLGYTRAELLSMKMPELDATADEGDCEAMLDSLKLGDALLVSRLYSRKNRSTYPVEVSLKYVELERSYVIAVSRDISERLKAEDAVRESEDRYRDLVEHSEDLVCTHDLAGRLLSVNAAPARILGYEPAELLNLPMRDLIVPEYRELFDAYLSRIKITGAEKGLMLVQPRTGEPRTWEYNNTLRTKGVAAPVVRGMAHDITERRKAELALSESEQRYRRLFEENLAGVVISTVEGRVVDCNDAWARMLGYGSAEEIYGRQAADFYFDPAQRLAVLEELKREGALREQEIQLRRKDGSPVWFLFNVVLLESLDGTQMAQGTLIDISKRKRAEENLVRREEDYRRFVAQSSEGIFREELDVPIPIDLPEDDLVQRILVGSYMAECNDAMARMYGFTSGNELLGKRLTEMLLPDDPRNIEMTRQYVRSGFRVLDHESHEVNVHGSRKVFRSSLIGIIENGNLVRTWGIQRDVTEQVRLETARTAAETALRKSEEHFRLLVEQATDGILLADADGRYTDANSAGAQMLGYSREELLKLSICDVVAPGDVARISSEISRFAEGATIRSEWTFRRKDGSCFPGEVSGKQLPDGRLQGILRDMSERRRAEQDLRRSEERFRVALKDSPITVFNQDQDLRYTWIYNPQLYWQFDALGKTDEEIVGTRKSAKLTSLKRQVLTTGLAVRDEIIVRNGGKGFVFDLTIEPLLDSAGNVVGITGVGMDIAKIRELADRLQDSRDRLQQEKSYLETEIRTELGFEHIIGESPALREVLKKARIVAPTDSTVLLLGETGTGKELVARSLHSLSTRHDKTFVKLNCAAVPSGLLESELFGHEKGAFTSAVSQKIGRIELADKGTLFLDEIGELPQELQPKLLRVLQDREFERLGGVHTLRVDVRIISATNRDLLQDVLDKNFREDLYYRLNVFPIQLPPLRDRREDIAILVQHFVEKHARRMGKHIDIIPDESMRILTNWKWPGNVRELENMVERMIILTTGNVLAAPPAGLEAMADCPTDDLSEMEREHIIHVLRQTNGVLAGADGAAVRLGLKRTTLQSMLKRFGIEAADFRRGNGAGGHN
jgi:formate hydrogenlyase transcriptional activator